MKSVITAFGHLQGGRVALDNEHQYRRDLAELRAKDGAPLIVRVSRATRSDKANAYLWGVVYPTIVAQSECGYTDVELHDAFCEKFLATQTKQVAFYNALTGASETVTTHRRSSALSGGPFYDFVEQVREFARVFWGIETPDPDSSYWRKRESAVLEMSA